MEGRSENDDLYDLGDLKKCVLAGSELCLFFVSFCLEVNQNASPVAGHDLLNWWYTGENSRYMRKSADPNQIVPARNPAGKNHEIIVGINRKDGWLIFYTHDIQADFSRFGCSAEYF